jgi:polyisoprenoid-binding protein YceI
MLIRYVTSLLRSLAAWIILSAASLAEPAAPLEQQTLTLDQARWLAIRALENGQPQLTLKVSEGLLQADPEDAEAHFLVAHAHAQLDQPHEGRRAAARAYRFSEEAREKFQAAQLAAQLAYAEDRQTLAQIWLRRTAIHAPNSLVERQIASDYRLIRASNPWYFRLRADLRPSSNVNNGADTSLQIIDGVPVTGTLSGAARALSGLIGSTDIITRYRLRGTANAATSVSGRLFIQRVALSSEARDLAPNARGSDFAATYGEISFRHAFAVGKEERRGGAYVDLAAGTSWYGGEPSYDFVRLSGERVWRLGGKAALRFNGLVEDRFNARYLSNDSEVLGLGALWTRPVRNDDRLTFSLALRDSDAKNENGTFRSASLRAGYAFGKPVGPVQISAGLVLGYTDYPDYVAGFIIVPGGRQDRSIYGDVNLLFNDMDYAGFAPILRLRTGRKSSNISRFDIRELTLALGIESKF